MPAATRAAHACEQASACPRATGDASTPGQKRTSRGSKHGRMAAFWVALPACPLDRVFKRPQSIRCEIDPATDRSGDVMPNPDLTSPQLLLFLQSIGGSVPL